MAAPRRRRADARTSYRTSHEPYAHRKGSCRVGVLTTPNSSSLSFEAQLADAEARVTESKMLSDSRDCASSWIEAANGLPNDLLKSRSNRVQVRFFERTELSKNQQLFESCDDWFDQRGLGQASTLPIIHEDDVAEVIGCRIRHRPGCPKPCGGLLRTFVTRLG